MTEFRYRAVDSQGEAVTGTMEAVTAHEATQALSEKGLTVNAVIEAHPQRGIPNRNRPLSWDDLQIFTEQLASIVKGGLPLAQSLHFLAQDLRHPRLKFLLEALHADLDKGESLETAIARQGDAFPKVFTAMVRAGESTGNLAGVTQLMADYSSRRVQMKNALQVTLAYPVLVTIACAAVLSFLLIKVVPVYANIFAEIGGQLPAPTRFWVGLSREFAASWPFWFGGALFLALVLQLTRRILARSESGILWLDTVRMRMPGIGRMFYLAAAGRFARTLSLLLVSRVPVVESLQLAGAVSGSPLLQQAVDAAARAVSGGERMADALNKTGLFSAHFCWLLATGEERGEAEAALESYAEACEREVQMRDRIMGLLFMPVTVVLLGLLVGSLAISLYLPIFTLGDAISGS